MKKFLSGMIRGVVVMMFGFWFFIIWIDVIMIMLKILVFYLGYVFLGGGFFLLFFFCGVIYLNE